MYADMYWFCVLSVKSWFDVYYKRTAWVKCTYLQGLSSESCSVFIVQYTFMCVNIKNILILHFVTTFKLYALSLKKC